MYPFTFNAIKFRAVTVDGKEWVYYPIERFRVNDKAVLYKPLKQEVVSETSVTYSPTYGKSRCALTYNDLNILTIQVSLRNNFKVKFEDIYFSYVFLNGQPYQTYMDNEALKLTFLNLTLQHTVQVLPVVYLQSIYSLKMQ